MTKPLREPSKQPDLKPWKLPADKRRGGAYDKPSLKPRGWPYNGSRGEDHPNFVPSPKGKKPY
jgi:hypothetical protein